eukprot:COSAG05_NODE_3720_length_1883_cov_1.542601_3_plen_69_part_00
MTYGMIHIFIQRVDWGRNQLPMCSESNNVAHTFTKSAHGPCERQKLKKYSTLGAALGRGISVICPRDV